MCWRKYEYGPPPDGPDDDDDNGDGDDDDGDDDDDDDDDDDGPSGASSVVNAKTPPAHRALNEARMAGTRSPTYLPGNHNHHQSAHQNQNQNQTKTKYTNAPCNKDYPPLDICNPNRQQLKEPEIKAGLLVWRSGGLVVWWSGGLLVWWSGGLLICWSGNLRKDVRSEDQIVRPKATRGCCACMRHCGREE